jgi:hypothetical protein
VIVRPRSPVFRRRGMAAATVPSSSGLVGPGNTIGAETRQIMQTNAKTIAATQKCYPTCVFSGSPTPLVYGDTLFGECMQVGSGAQITYPAGCGGNATAPTESNALATQNSIIAALSSIVSPSSSSSAAPAAGSPAQSNAPNPVSVTPVAAAAGGGYVTPGAAVAVTPGAAVAGGGCFALFNDPSCWGPIGSTTALVFGGALLALFLIFGGHK